MSAETEQRDIRNERNDQGWRLHTLEVFNWGTFDQKIWPFHVNGKTALLTGDIGSGKSTLVDALTTLLIAPNKQAFNKAAGAESRERSLRSYVLGHYKSERRETGETKAVSLRDQTSYSVLLAHFVNSARKHSVTIAQFFWCREDEGQPVRVYVVADTRMSIAEHFSSPVSIGALKKKLRSVTKDVFDTFTEYQASFSSKLGIQSTQALDLLQQTVSMKSVGNLTDFVRQHMLQPANVAERIDHLIAHFENLTRAHNAVLRAKDQITRLNALDGKFNEFEAHTKTKAAHRSMLDALRPFIVARKTAMIEDKIQRIESEVRVLSTHVGQGEQDVDDALLRCDAIRRSIFQNGGEHLETLRTARQTEEQEKTRRQQQWALYHTLAERAGLSEASDANVFFNNVEIAQRDRPAVSERLDQLKNREFTVRTELNGHLQTTANIQAELASLMKRRSNIPEAVLAHRTRMCSALGLGEEEFSFVGELVQVRPEQRRWQGAIERVLRNFGMSLLVSEKHYRVVSDWVEQTHLRGRLTYQRVPMERNTPELTPDSDGILAKLELKSGRWSPWLRHTIDDRFRHVCCESMDVFRLHSHALSINGQIKTPGGQHTKDDRTSIDDYTQYVLGWSNTDKIQAFRSQLETVQALVDGTNRALVECRRDVAAQTEKLDAMTRIQAFTQYAQIHWQACALRLDALAKELEATQASSNILATLEESLKQQQARLQELQKTLQTTRDRRTQLTTRKEHFDATHQQLLVEGTATTAVHRECFELIEGVVETLGNAKMGFDTIDSVERSLRGHLAREVERIESVLSPLRERIVKAMQEYRTTYPEETRDTDASIDAMQEFRRMRTVLLVENFPRFEQQFKELLNENTIREIANFQSQLDREKGDISEHLEWINASLMGIEFNAGRYIKLVADRTHDIEVKEFQQSLRECTAGTLNATVDEQYSEEKFRQVTKIIERFRGRPQFTSIDQQWTRKVSDVRNWFTFSASERWIENDQEHERYNDSGGKSGGQKEKLAYTILAASLAYQYRLNQDSGRAFRFVVIDEAFGRGSDESTTYALSLFKRLDLQLLIVTPLQKIRVIEPFVAQVGFVSNESGQSSKLRNFTIEEYQRERTSRVTIVANTES